MLLVFALFLFCLFDFYGIEPKLWWHIYGSQTKFVRHIVFAHTVKDWKNLPPDIAAAKSLE
jgi:hypothetical protein